MSQTAQGPGRTGRGWVKEVCRLGERAGRGEEHKDKVRGKTADCFLQEEKRFKTLQVRGRVQRAGRRGVGW